jgi:hypothetical protein
MSSRLEDFVRNNREEFDTDVPSCDVWSNINSRLNPAPQPAKVVGINWKRFLSAAAVVIIAAGAFFWIARSTQSVNKPPVEATASTTENEATDKVVLDDINPAYAKEVYHFTKLIELKQGELKQIEKENPQLYQQFVGEINKLDSSYNALKQELPANPNREQLLEAMIRNLQVQMDLLNQQLQIIQEIKQSKNKNASTLQG